MNLFWISLGTAVSVLGGSSLCFWLLHQAREVDTTLWILEHIICPIIRIVVLLIVVSLVYPTFDASSSSVEFWRILSRQGEFQDLINILFLVGLGLAFLPIVNHPVFALPIQSMLSIALVFYWQYQAAIATPDLFPSLATLIKIVVYMACAYFVTRQTIIWLGRRLDEKFSVAGSVRLISDTIYMVLQIPVMLLYGSYLQQLLT